MSRQMATVSVDLDNLWCYQRSMGDTRWQVFETCLPVSIPRILKLLADKDIQATFFVVAKDTENPKHTPLWQAILEAGHELASHSYHHDMAMPSWSDEDILRELSLAHEAIAQICGVTPQGFRAPAFGINNTMRKSLCALGYRYDASDFYSSTGALARWYHLRRAIQPGEVNAAEGYGAWKEAWHSQAPQYEMQAEPSLWRLPVTTMPVFRTPFHGTYLHFLAGYGAATARQYFNLALTLCHWRNQSPSFLLHATDVLGQGEFPALDPIPGMHRSLQDKLMLTTYALSRLAERYELVTHIDYCDGLEKHNMTTKDA